MTDQTTTPAAVNKALVESGLDRLDEGIAKLHAVCVGIAATNVHLNFHHVNRESFDLLPGEEHAVLERENDAPPFWSKTYRSDHWLLAQFFTDEPPADEETVA